MIADCLLWEELDSLQHVFGEHVGLDNLPTLSRLYLEAPGRAAFQKVLSSSGAGYGPRDRGRDGDHRPHQELPRGLSVSVPASR